MNVKIIFILAQNIVKYSIVSTYKPKERLRFFNYQLLKGHFCKLELKYLGFEDTSSVIQ